MSQHVTFQPKLSDTHIIIRRGTCLISWFSWCMCYAMAAEKEKKQFLFAKRTFKESSIPPSPQTNIS